MPVADYRVYSSRLIRPDASSDGVKLKVVEQFTVRDSRRRYQDFTFTLRNSPNGKRMVKVVDVKDLSTSTTGDSLSVERIVKFNEKTPENKWWESISTFWSGRDPVIHKKTHTRKIYATDDAGNKNTDVWIKVRRTDQIHFVDPKDRSAQVIFYFSWPDLEDPEWDYTDVPKPITTWDFEEYGINPPWRLDPFQDIIDCSFGGTYLMALYNGNHVAALNFNKILEIIGATGYTGATGGYTGVTGVNVYATGLASSWGTDKLKTSVFKFGPTGASGPSGPTGASGPSGPTGASGPPPTVVLCPLAFGQTGIEKKPKQYLSTIWRGTHATGATAPTGATGTTSVLDNSLETSLEWREFPMIRSDDATLFYTAGDKFLFEGGWLTKKDSWAYGSTPHALLADGHSWQDDLFFVTLRNRVNYDISQSFRGWQGYLSGYWSGTRNLAAEYPSPGKEPVSLAAVMRSYLLDVSKTTLSWARIIEEFDISNLYSLPPDTPISGTLMGYIPFQTYTGATGYDYLGAEQVTFSASESVMTTSPLGYEFGTYSFDFESFSRSGSLDNNEDPAPSYYATYVPISFPPSLGKNQGDKFYYIWESDDFDSFLNRMVFTPYGNFTTEGFSGVTDTTETGVFGQYVVDDYKGWLHLSNGRHYLQAFKVFKDWKVFIDKKDASKLIAEAIGVPLTDVQTMILGVPLARIKEFK